MKEIALGIVRHVLSAAGGILVSKGYVGNADSELIVGAIITIASVVWSALQKRQQQAQLELQQVKLDLTKDKLAAQKVELQEAKAEVQEAQDSKSQ